MATDLVGASAAKGSTLCLLEGKKSKGEKEKKLSSLSLSLARSLSPLR